MDFYQTLSTYYDEIFPVNDQEIQFVLEHLTLDNMHVLDVGCATGEMAIELSKRGYVVQGCDLDEEMIKQATEKGKREGQDIRTKVLDMRSLQKEYKKDQFGGVLCTGNTLVHLNSLQEMQDVLNQMFQLMHEDGKIIIQIINYDRILSKNVRTLPSIQTKNIRFERKYQYEPETNKIIFSTELQVDHQEKHYKYVNSISLYPLRFAELYSMMEKAGFQNIEAYGNFKGEIYHEDSYAMIITAIK